MTLESFGSDDPLCEPGKIRILVVDDHPLLRDGIAVLLGGQRDMELVAQACSGSEGVQQFRKHVPDITLMDLQMPEMNGVEAMIAIREEFPSARIIVLTTYVGDAQVLRALEAGMRITFGVIPCFGPIILVEGLDGDSSGAQD